jgi:hypothetical protein
VDTTGAFYSVPPDTTKTTPFHFMTEAQTKREINATDGGWRKRVDATKYEDRGDSAVLERVTDEDGLQPLYLKLFNYKFGNDVGLYSSNEIVLNRYSGSTVGSGLGLNYVQVGIGQGAIENGVRIGSYSGVSFFNNRQIGIFSDDNDTIKVGRNYSGVGQGDYFYTTKTGSIGIVSNGVKKYEVDSTGLIKTAFMPHAQSTFSDSSISINLTQDVWTQITRPISKTTWPTTEFWGFTDSGDTIAAQYSGHYIANYDINITGLDNKTYEYRLMRKNGTTSEVWRYKVSGTGITVLRSINAYLDLIVGSKFWVEIRCTSLAPGSVTIFGGRMTVHPVHINF